MRHAILWLTLVIAAALPAAAHDPGLSSAAVEIGGSTITATITLASADVPALASKELARDALALELDGRRLEPSAADFTRDGNNVELRSVFSRPPGTRLRLRSRLLATLPAGHRQYLALRGDGGRMLAERMLAAGDADCEATLEQAPRPATVATIRQFLLLGIEHIATGYDHLVFLAGLLLAGSRLRQALAIITSFTAAHSLTLGLAALGVVALPPRVVEPLIALSIVYVGLENIWSRRLERRWRVTFLFGLAHGFGFASALRELGIGSNGGGIGIPLVSFNLGVEFGQVAVALVLLPILWRLRRRASFQTRWVPACSCAVALAGGYWLIERTFFG